tara:strand:+ start:7323 stop:7655 length:333 start_codon:yes stop_codon:yes gene_type:complete
MYKVTQTKKVFSALKLYKKTIKKDYFFKSFYDALKFAANEQINKFYFVKGKIKTSHKTFDYLHSLQAFKNLCKINASFYLGVNNYSSVKNIDTYYFYLINSNQLIKLKKY